MKLVHKSTGYRFNAIWTFPFASLLTLVNLPPMAVAQEITEIPPTPTSLLTSTANTSTVTPISTDLTTLVVIHNITLPITSSTHTETAPAQIYPTPTDTDGHPFHDSKVFNYYFLFLAAFVILAAGGLRWLHLRRKRKQQQQRLSGQHALARDLEGWGGARRFMHGRVGRYQTARSRRDEGLNENGEAPPPYQPKSEAMVEVWPEPVVGPALPPRTLAQDESDRVRPPGYNATTREL